MEPIESNQPIQTLLPPQLNTTTLKTAMDRTNYWREGVKGLYDNNMDIIPHGFFIHIEDILELSRLYHYYGAQNRTITGVRAYLTLHQPQPDKEPYTDAITALLVPVERVLQTVGQTDLIVYIDKDLIVPAPKLDGTPGNEGDNVTVYDVTMPCPKICDPTSPLF